MDLSSSVENEWLCAQILKAYNIPVADCWIETFGAYKALVVERFDRRLASGGKWYLRLPQEDFCQATGISPGLKYQSDGGPGIARIMEILLGSEQAELDRHDFMRTQVLFWLLAAIDGHAKNFSIFLLPGGSYRLTPRYDIISAYPLLGHGRGKLAPQKIRMAMAVWGKNRHYRWNEISARHFLHAAKACSFGEMRAVLQELIEATPAVLEKVGDAVPAKFPAEIADSILAGLRKQVGRLKAELSSLQ
jgi:serine/threonine-protein kinase HipA